MLNKLLEILKAKGDLIDISKEETLDMLRISKEMFAMVFNASSGAPNHSIKKGISKIDKEINEKKKHVRHMVYEHLAITGAKDLIKSIQFFSMVYSIERIGDYVKNLAEILDYVPEKPAITNVYFDRFSKIIKETSYLFDITNEALKNEDVAKATEVVVKYQDISSSCESIIKDIMCSKEDSISKSDVKTLMLARFTKRISAHLRNVAIIFKDPIDSIDHPNIEI